MVYIAYITSLGRKKKVFYYHRHLLQRKAPSSSKDVVAAASRAAPLVLNNALSFACRRPILTYFFLHAFYVVARELFS